jgi:hypothetical protein
MDELDSIVARQAKLEQPVSPASLPPAPPSWNPPGPSGMSGYPVDHQIGIEVPSGGASCANCRFWQKTECISPHFVASSAYPDKPTNNGKIPGEPATFCCDFWRGVVDASAAG